MVFPLFKLGGLFFKTAMKPLSNGLKSYAKSSKSFSNGCYWIANTYFKSYNAMAKALRLPYQVTPLTNEQALKLGTDLVGEGAVFGAAVGVLYYEYAKSSKISRASGNCKALTEQVDGLESKIDQDRKMIEGFTMSTATRITELEKKHEKRMDYLEDLIDVERCHRENISRNNDTSDNVVS